MATTSGYSGTPLPKKLGLKDGQSVAFVGLPESQRDLTNARAFSYTEQASRWEALTQSGFDFIHLFTKDAAVVRAALEGLRHRIKPDGMLWFSWPKKASKVETDVTEDTIRNHALTLDLVDVKVCAVDEIWSGLKIVIRKEHRSNYPVSQGTTS